MILLKHQKTKGANKMNEQAIAKEIQRQVMIPSKMVVMSWGVNEWRVLPEGKLEGGYCLGGLSFRVRGHHLKGHVCIHLMGDDTYTIRFLNVRMREVKKLEGIYCDQLQDLIDEVVEYK